MKSTKKLCIQVERRCDDEWSFGINFNHSPFGETYLYIGFFKWYIAIGYMY